MEYESLTGPLSVEVQNILTSLQSDGDVTVKLSPELAKMMSKFLQVAASQGGVAFGPMSPEITPKQAAEILDIDLVLLERRVQAGVLKPRQKGNSNTFDLVEVLHLKEIENARDNLLMEINDTLEGSDTAMVYG
jgi:hypothetical protein